MGDAETDVQRIFKGERTFDRLMTSPAAGGGKAERLTDAFLKKKLAKDHPWIKPLYEQTSDFVHLSFRQLFTAMAATDAAMQIATMAISGTDPKQDESVYYEVCDAFFSVSRLTSMTILAVLMARQSDRGGRSERRRRMTGSQRILIDLERPQSWPAGLLDVLETHHEAPRSREIGALSDRF
ncbi:hypothetical protein [Mesorhizobium sp.]|uniref:hypothetical protein n=1 Tax=Mesorhizobium sp. TaxID=1871066 RepID=UPI0012004649|nr:hypothetical protein [Mesorhizobium sp.]TIP18449.1 MAG: hypothetical protein E5X66_15835 [Mesorhizobium sp.]